MSKTKIFSSIILPFGMLMNIAGVIGVERAQKAPKSVDMSYIQEDAIESTKMDRVGVLERFFDKYNSPLRNHAKTFVAVADKYDMDFRLLPAISCIESSCGKKLIPDSYNPFGWGIYGNNVTTFRTYDEAIEVVGKGIKTNYIEKGFDTPEKIAPIYTPPAHKHWLGSVKFFMKEINKINEAKGS